MVDVGCGDVPDVTLTRVTLAVPNSGDRKRAKIEPWTARVPVKVSVPEIVEDGVVVNVSTAGRADRS